MFLLKRLGIQESEEGESSLLDIAKKAFVNLKYKVQGNINLQEGSSIERRIFGKSGTAKECEEMIKRTIWITYRDGIKWMGRYSSDNLWGCMMRVGQMQLTKLLQMYRDFKRLDISDSIIIRAFDDDSKRSVYSSMRILSGPLAVEYALIPGNWMTASQIAHVLSGLHERTPLEGFEGLRIVVQENAIYFNELSEAMGFERCKHMSFHCKECKKMPREKDRHVAVIVMGILNSQRGAIPEMMKSELFTGMIGGVQNQAYYFIGYQQNIDQPSQSTKLFYLDPQIASKQVEILDFSCSKFRLVSIDTLEKQIGFCFYLSNFQDIARLENLMLLATNSFGKDMPFLPSDHRAQRQSLSPNSPEDEYAFSRREYPASDELDRPSLEPVDKARSLEAEHGKDT